MPKYRVQYFTKTVKGKTYRHPWIGFRQRNQNGTPTFVAVASLVGIPDEVVAQIDLSLQGRGDAGFVQFLDSECIGSSWAAWSIAERLGIWQALCALDEPFRQIVTAMVLDRVVADLPSSKLDLWERLKTDKAVLTRLASPIVQEATLHDFYSSLEKLRSVQEAIEQQLHQRRGAVDRIFLYDITSSYFEGLSCPLSDYGYNRDGKKGKKQIVIGLLTDERGMPISAEVFQGNTTDQTTVLGQIRKVQARFGAKQIVFVGDRGMLTASNREKLTDEEFDDVRYISALPRAELAEVLERCAKPVADDLFTRREMFEICDDGQRVVFNYNPLRAMEDRETRERLDGWFAIVSDLPIDDHTSKELVERYKSLKHVESAFRTMKTTDLFIRPIRHWNPERVKGHVFLCMLSYMIIFEARQCFAEFLAPVKKEDKDDETTRQSLQRAWATLNTIKIGKLNIDGKVVEQLSPVSQAAKKLLAAAGAKLNQAAKRQLGLAD